MQTDAHRELGIQFEIFLELLLKAQNGLYNVHRNVEYHKARYLYRQVDVSYNFVQDGRLMLVLVEAKYSSNGVVGYERRKGEASKAGQDRPINNIVDEVAERHDFVKADISVLATNRRFDDRVHAEANRHGFKILEGGDLTKAYRSAGGIARTIDEHIRGIRIRDYNHHKNIIYVS